MAEKFAEIFKQYSTNNKNELEQAISALDSLVSEADPKTRISFLPKLEQILEKFKGHNVPGLASAEGWSPLVKVLHEAVHNGNTVHQENAFAATVQLLGHGQAHVLRNSASDFAQMTLEVIDKENKCPDEVREAALHALNALLEKFPSELPPALMDLYPMLQPALLGILPEKNNESLRTLAHKCMSQLINFHTDPDSLFFTIQDMGMDDELLLKDDFLLDDLLDRTMGRQNELTEQRNRNGGMPSAAEGENNHPTQ